MSIKSTIFFISLFVLFLCISACGGSSSYTNPVIYDSVSTTTYKLEYIPVTASAEGKTEYKIRLTNKSDGKTVTGKSITLAAKMTMTSMSHSTPVTALTDNRDGTYSGNIYYVMASVDSTGASTGTWELKFTVDGETATFNPGVVAMATGKVAKLKGIYDKISSTLGMGDTTPRTYQIFNDGITGTNVKLFISAVDDDMMMSFPAVSIGTILHDSMGTDMEVTSMVVKVSTDKKNWIALTDGVSGYWSKSGVASMATGSTIYVRLTVNDELKTTDGKELAGDGSNGYQSLTVAGM